MNPQKPIKSALISVFHKDGLEPIIEALKKHNIQIYSTGGTQKFIESCGAKVTAVESLTNYPSILGGRVKTLHPKVFGGILSRRDNESDKKTLTKFDIPEIDLVIVDLYPFEETVASGSNHEDIIEKIDIGGISLIRAAAKNYKDVLCVASQSDYQAVLDILNKPVAESSFEERKAFAVNAFAVSSHYDTKIFGYLNQPQTNAELRLSKKEVIPLRYGENPHQNANFYGNSDEVFEQLHGKALSYNNLLDIDAAVNLINEFQGEAPTFAVLKHNNACGLAQRDTILEAYKDALAGDPVSAFGGILVANTKIDKATAEEIHQLFCEVVIAPKFEDEALEILKGKKNRRILILKQSAFKNKMIRTCLNGVLVQDRDLKTDQKEHFKTVTQKSPSDTEIDDLVFASKICKHTKSNTIVLAKNKQLIASGTGQTSRVDALKQSIEKSKHFKFDLKGAVMASDAFFPFPDCVEIADKAGISAVIQPGGSIKDELSINYCNENNMSMVMTGIRHFKH
ncbi:bifunctional phosphoribosylaminoimidazolecarboxamide formyltransferase/IMP cyclohydrolase [Psychroflexus sp. MBR-150]|jgi:phosphoribosylaminoimidazolecarboxamide formyltransferase/IMP cyclohydrolase